MNPQPQIRGLRVDHGVYLRYHRDHVWRLYALHGETLVGDAYTVAGFERKISKLAVADDDQLHIPPRRRS
jgi:hypothetical protein